MGDVVEIGRERRFTLKEARELLPVLRRITEEAVGDVERLQAQILTAEEGSELASRTRDRIEEVYQTWIRKTRRLGAHPKGPWLLDLDNGEDYYCWRWPEEEIRWAHGYETGFAGRYPVEEPEEEEGSPGLS